MKLKPLTVGSSYPLDINDSFVVAHAPTKDVSTKRHDRSFWE